MQNKRWNNRRSPAEWKKEFVGEADRWCSLKCLNSQEPGPGTRPECWSFVPPWEPLPAFDTMPKPHAPHSRRSEVGAESSDPAPAVAISSSPILGSSPTQVQLPTLQTCQISRTFKRIVTYKYTHIHVVWFAPCFNTRSCASNEGSTKATAFFYPQNPSSLQHREHSLIHLTAGAFMKHFWVRLPQCLFWGSLCGHAISNMCVCGRFCKNFAAVMIVHVDVQTLQNDPYECSITLAISASRMTLVVGVHCVVNELVIGKVHLA